MKRICTAVAPMLVLAVLGGPAAASCAAPPPLPEAIDDARTVFVGTVTDTSNDDRWATVAVSDVWKGDVAGVVEVRGGPADPPGPMEAASSVDRAFRDGATYLFVPSGGDGEVFHDDACSSTTRYGERFDHLRPDDAATPGPFDAAPRRAARTSVPLWWGVAAIAGAAAVVLLLRRRGRNGRVPSDV